jgi:hypothetical protein
MSRGHLILVAAAQHTLGRTSEWEVVASTTLQLWKRRCCRYPNQPISPSLSWVLISWTRWSGRSAHRKDDRRCEYRRVVSRYRIERGDHSLEPNSSRELEPAHASGGCQTRDLAGARTLHIAVRHSKIRD